jgi:hypothetical protein
VSEERRPYDSSVCTLPEGVQEAAGQLHRRCGEEKVNMVLVVEDESGELVKWAISDDLRAGTIFASVVAFLSLGKTNPGMQGLLARLMMQVAQAAITEMTEPERNAEVD